MRCNLNSIADLAAIAERLLQRNLSVYPEFIRDAALGCHAFLHGQPQLLTWGGVQIDRIENLQYSPFYRGTGLNNLLNVADPPIEAYPDYELAKLCHGLKMDALFPVGIFTHEEMARHAHAQSEYWTSTLAQCGQLAITVAMYDDDLGRWCDGFTSALDSADNAGSQAIGLASHRRQSWSSLTQDEVAAMIANTPFLFATALDGDGFVVWTVTTGQQAA
ncbi:MAG: hypothetical protein AAGG44_20730 [Planctomycetota bacterium]